MSSKVSGCTRCAHRFPNCQSGDEPSEVDIENGSGQHVGTANEVAKRLQSALYFIGSRWRDAPRTLVEVSADKPAEGADPCHITGSCNFEFTSSFGRKRNYVIVALRSAPLHTCTPLVHLATERLTPDT